MNSNYQFTSWNQSMAAQWYLISFARQGFKLRNSVGRGRAMPPPLTVAGQHSTDASNCYNCSVCSAMQISW